MNNSTISIDSVAHFIEQICKLQQENNIDLSLPHCSLLFRGQADSTYDLLPSLGRGRKHSVSYTIMNEERNLIEMAKFKMPNIFHNELSPIELLALLQHHGIPTRLMDLSENPLVALYFACKSDDTNKNKDGEVFVFKAVDTDVANYPVINAIADSYKFCQCDYLALSDFYGNVREQPYFLEQKYMQSICNPSDVDGGKWIAKCCDRIIYLYAPFQTIRQQVQQSRYILFPNAIDSSIAEDEPVFVMEMKPIPKCHDDIISHFVVPSGKKDIILSELSYLGITEAHLFCDSIDKVCGEITQTFKNRY